MKYVAKVAVTLCRSLVHTRRKIGTLATARLLVMFLRMLWHIGFTTRRRIARAERLATENQFSPRLRRTVLTEIRAQSATRIVELVERGFHVRWERDNLSDITEGMGPFIVVANHNNTVEIVALMALLTSLGIRNLKFVAKAGLSRAPVVGYLLRMCGDALVHRSAAEGDLEEVFQKGRVACADGASFAIFPEGTRFLGPVLESRFTCVGNPKVGGFRELVRAYGNAPVLAVCFDWVNLKPGEGRSMADIGDYYGAHLRTTCRFFWAGEDAVEELEDIFQWFEQERTREGADAESDTMDEANASSAGAH